MAVQYGYRACWEPNKQLILGAIVKLQKGMLSMYSSLQKEGIPMEIMGDTSKGVLDYSSSGNVKISVKLAGDIPLAGSVLTKGDAGFNISFETDKAIVFQLDETTTEQITNLADIEKEIRQRDQDGRWEKNWLIVTELMSAMTGTIIISYSNNSNIDLKANANVGSQNFNLTDASLNLTVASEQGEHIKVIAKNGITPLYKITGLRHPLFGKVKLETKGFNEPPKKESEEKFKIQPFLPAELEE